MGAPLSGFDVLAFSVSFEEDFLGLVRVLAASGIPVESARRTDDDPIVVMGGVCALLNPEPVAPFVDAVLVGDAPALVPPLAESLAASRGRGRAERLAILATVPGAYVPALYEVERGSDGIVTEFRASAGAPLPVVAAFAAGRSPAETAVISDAAHFSGMHLVEASTGCARGCRFCVAGHVYRPVVFHTAERVLASVRRGLELTDRIGLVSAALADHPDAAAILAGAGELGAELSVSSVHVDMVDEGLAGLLVRSGVRTLTVAPEAGTEGLRRAIGKDVADEALINAARTAGAAGAETLRLYFMVGLPGEGADDLEAIPRLVALLREAFAAGRPRARVAVSVSAFVPKPRTPFQWLPMAGEKAIRSALSAVRRGLARGSTVDFTSAGPREARREGLLARGGRELAPAVELTAVRSAPWKSALKRCGIDAGATLDRQRGEDEVFPWELVDVGVPRGRLLGSYRDAMRLIEAR